MIQPMQLLAHAKMMLDNARREGHTPVAFMMNGSMRDLFAAAVNGERNQNKSALSRLFSKDSTVLRDLFDLPIIENPGMPNGAYTVQLAAPPEEQEAMNRALAQGAQAAMAGLAPAPPQQNAQSPFWNKERVEPGQVPDKPSLGDIAGGQSDRPSVTDILIKSLEGADNLKQIVVIRVHKNDDVDASSNCNRFEIHGILQKLSIWLQMRD